MQPLVDGDILVYRCGFAADSQMKKRFKEENPGISDDDLAELLETTDYETHALGNVKTVLVDIHDKYGPINGHLYLTGKGNFREKVATILPYKGNRDPTHKPKYYDSIREYMHNIHRAKTITGYEADDEIGMLQTYMGDDSIIVSIDKDLDMIAGFHYNLMRNEQYYCSKQYADSRFFWQMLVGDKTDNIPGIRGIGEKRADAMVDRCRADVDAMRHEVQEMYAKQYGDGWEAAYNEVGRLLWIARYREEIEEGCPLLWN